MTNQNQKQPTPSTSKSEASKKADKATNAVNEGQDEINDAIENPSTAPQQQD